jgi:NADP-dependent 3-hydroxy acid dehydrogenase YdfG
MTASPTIVVLTGSNSGLGYETVKSLLASSVPYKIYCGARSLDKARKTVDSLSSAKKPADILVPLVLDVSSDESIAAATKTVAEADGRVDVLINNAGKYNGPSRWPRSGHVFAGLS